MSEGIVTAAYISAAILFILSLGGLSHQETARKGNFYGMLGMFLALVAAIAGVTANFEILIGGLVVGGFVGIWVARSVQMTQMPELVAVLHSLVGMGAVLVGFANFLDPVVQFTGVELTIHHIETYLGIFIGMVTFAGSVVAFGKLSGKLGGQPLLLPMRHGLNLIALVATVILGIQFVQSSDPQAALMLLLIMSAVALLFGFHLVAAIGGADMPVVISMLNSYSGWAAAATGFLLGNDLLVVVGALVGSSGAILSYIMCKAMNRQFLSVILGGFGNKPIGSSGGSSSDIEGEVTPIESAEVAKMLKEAKKIMIVPGYGMAVAQAQHVVKDITQKLRAQKIDVQFAIHPVAGRMPGHMNVLLAEANVPYDIVCEMEEVNEGFEDVDVTLIIGANDIVNPAAQTEPESPIAGMPVLKVWNSKATVVLKRSMASGYAGVENPLFYMENTRMLFGDGKSMLDEVSQSI